MCTSVGAQFIDNAITFLIVFAMSTLSIVSLESGFCASLFLLLMGCQIGNTWLTFITIDH